MDTKKQQNDLPQKAVVAMSGGVDSSVAAMLLAENGVDVTGVTFRLPFYGERGEVKGRCCGVSGIEDARRVCRRLGIKHYVLDYREIFERTVFENFCSEYRKGRTPNPCIRCNDLLKFGVLAETAMAMGVSTVASGHYVQRLFNGRDWVYELHKGLEGVDQSYFLFSLSQEQLSRAFFPLGAMTKEQVRKIAKSAGLNTHDKPKSQDLCFLPDGGYGRLLKKRYPKLCTIGEIRHVSGRKLGRHDGAVSYTIGQRKRLGIAWKEPLYVVGIDASENVVVAGEKRYLQKSSLMAGELNWISGAPEIGEPIRCVVKIRFRHHGTWATVRRAAGGKARVDFDEPQTAPAPGQAAVFYSGRRVIGGGFIESSDTFSG